MFLWTIRGDKSGLAVCVPSYFVPKAICILWRVSFGWRLCNSACRRPNSKGAGHVLNARMLGAPLRTGIGTITHLIRPNFLAIFTAQFSVYARERRIMWRGGRRCFSSNQRPHISSVVSGGPSTCQLRCRPKTSRRVAGRVASVPGQAALRYGSAGFIHISAGQHPPAQGGRADRRLCGDAGEQR